MLNVKLRKSVGTVERELLKEGRKFNTYKMSFEDFDNAVDDLNKAYDSIEYTVGWLTGYSSKSTPLKMEFVHQVATSVKISDRETGKTLLKWSKE